MPHKEPFILIHSSSSVCSACKVVLEAYPSRTKNEAIIKAEKERVQKQKDTLGPEGRKREGEKVAAAIKSQTLPPQEVLESVPVADVNKIKYR